MSEELLLQLIGDYGYIAMYALMLLEGPVVTMGAAFLASLGHLSWPIVFLVSLVGDMSGDLLLYGIGRRWGVGFAERYGKYIGITPEALEKMQKFFDLHGGKTVFFAKSTTGLCFVTFVAAGVARMPVRELLKYSFLGGVIWSGFLVVIGYFFGYLYEQIAVYISWAGWLIFAIGAATLMVISFYKKRHAQQIFDNKHIE